MSTITASLHPCQDSIDIRTCVDGVQVLCPAGHVRMIPCDDGTDASVAEFRAEHEACRPASIWSGLAGGLLVAIAALVPGSDTPRAAIGMGLGDIVGLCVAVALACGVVLVIGTAICLAPRLDRKESHPPTLRRSIKLGAVVYALFGLSGWARAADPVFDRTLRAIHQVESSGGRDTRDGDRGLAIGPYQIHKGYWSDACRVLGVNWPYSDARDPAKAAAAVEAYTRHYAKVHRQPWTAETIARIHNGGPLGWKKRATVKYYLRVREAMGQ